jgi:hypothetical protein
MIQFCCWYCNKRYALPKQRVGERLTCTCQRLLRVPARSGGYSRVKTAADWLVEVAVYGVGGALLGAGLGTFFLSQWPPRPPALVEEVLVVALAAVGFLAGLFGGERGVNWVGRMIREQEH